MNSDVLKEHLESYRTCVRHDTPPEVVEFAQSLPSKKPELYRTAFDYVGRTLSAVKEAANRGLVIDYKEGLIRHQRALSSVLTLLVKRELETYGGGPYDRLRTLMAERGRTWFKYAPDGYDMPVEIGGRIVDIVFLPQRTPEAEKKWAGPGRVFFDADEAHYCFQTLPDSEDDVLLARAVVNFKAEYPGEKVLAVVVSPGESPAFSHATLADFNKGWVVDDWTMPLWPEGV